MNTNDLTRIVERIKSASPDQLRWVIGDCTYGMDKGAISQLSNLIGSSQTSMREYRLMAQFWDIKTRTFVHQTYPRIAYSQLRIIMYVAQDLDEALCLVRKVASRDWSANKTARILKRWRPRRNKIEAKVIDLDKSKPTPKRLTAECEVLDYTGLVYKLALYGDHVKHLEHGKLYRISFREVVL